MSIDFIIVPIVEKLYRATHAIKSINVLCKIGMSRTLIMLLIVERGILVLLLAEKTIPTSCVFLKGIKT